MPTHLFPTLWQLASAIFFLSTLLTTLSLTHPRAALVLLLAVAASVATHVLHDVSLTALVHLLDLGSGDDMGLFLGVCEHRCVFVGLLAIASLRLVAFLWSSGERLPTTIFESGAFRWVFRVPLERLGEQFRVRERAAQREHWQEVDALYALWDEARGEWRGAMEVQRGVIGMLEGVLEGLNERERERDWEGSTLGGEESEEDESGSEEESGSGSGSDESEEEDGDWGWQQYGDEMGMDLEEESDAEL